MEKKDRHNGGAAVADAPTPAAVTSAPATTEKTEEKAAQATNFKLFYKRNHPQDRSSYGIPGNTGIVVFQRSLFANAGVPKDIHDPAGLPTEITLSVEMAPIKEQATAKASKLEAAAQKAAEKARKAAERVEAEKAKAESKAADAQKKLEEAKARVAAAQAKANPAAAPAA